MLAFVPPLTKAGYVRLEATTSEACLLLSVYRLLFTVKLF